MKIKNKSAKKVSMTVTLPEQQVRHVRARMKALGIPAQKLEEIWKKWIEEAEYDDTDLAVYHIYPDRKSAQRVANREMKLGWNSMELSYLKKGEPVSEVFHPAFLTKFRKDHPGVAYTIERGPRGKRIAKPFVENGPVKITAVVSPDIRDALEARAKNRGIDMNLLIRASLWDTYPELPLSDPPEPAGKVR